MPAIATLRRVSPPIPAAEHAQLTQVKPRHVAPGISLVALATVLTVANCVKPLQVDDAAYVLYAAHIAEHPLAPYDFAVYWGYQFQPANQVLAPPVFLYWLAAARAALGDNPILWKLTLFPWHCLLAVSLFSLLRRWTGPLSLPLSWMILLSPALLPSTNLMLDVPALALSLTAVALFVHAVDRASWRFALLAGLTAGLAMQTKYSAFVIPAVLLCYGLTQGRLRLACLAAATAIGLFATWELYVAVTQGDSHFLLAAKQRGDSLLSRVRHMILPTLTLTAALAPGVLFAAALGWRRHGRGLGVMILVALSGFALLGILPARHNEWLPNATTGRAAFKIDGALYGAWTVLWWSALALAIWRQCRNHRPAQEPLSLVKVWRVRTNSRLPRGIAAVTQVQQADAAGPSETQGHSAKARRAVFAFLLLWMGCEIAGAVVLSPFPAARRVLGVTVAATILIGFLIARLQPSRRLAWTAAGASMIMGAAVALIDVREAQATQELASTAVEIAQRENPGGRSWFSGAWAFQYYGMRQGLLPIAPEVTTLQAGDLLILSEQQLNRIDFRPDNAPLMKLQVVELRDHLPWQTLSCYYCGPTPLRHHEGARLKLTVYCVVEDFVARGHGVLPGVP